MNSMFADWLLPALLGVGLLAAWTFVAQTVWSLRHYRLRLPDTPPPTLKQLPTVTLGIPARNETNALTSCLQAAIASDYPKLEIIVLDDCSQDATSELIRAFAQDGVRFVQGEEPDSDWLGKNNAMRTLAQHASGEYIIFTSVDTRLAPGSIGQLVHYMVTRQLDMISVLPQRREGLHWGTVLWQLKYYWQIVVPITKNHVPMASQSWAITGTALKRLGGFEAVPEYVAPEGHFARHLAPSQGYRFLLSNASLGITTAKSWLSQKNSALRLLYPTCHRQPLLVIAACLAVVAMLFPFAYSVYAIVSGAFDSPYAWLALTTAGLFWLSYGLVVYRTHPHTWMVTLLFFPLSLVQEIVLLIASMVEYQTGRTSWKGRNICYPVLKNSKFLRKHAH